MKRLAVIAVMIWAAQVSGQKKPIEPIKPPVIATAKLVIDHQNITINKTQYTDAKLIYTFSPIRLEKCNKKKLISEIDAVKENANKLTVEYQDSKLGKMSQVYLGAMPKVVSTEIISK